MIKAKCQCGNPLNVRSTDSDVVVVESCSQCVGIAYTKGIKDRTVELMAASKEAKTEISKEEQKKGIIASGLGSVNK